MKYSRSVVSRTFYIRPLFFRVNLHYQYQYKVCLIIIRYYCQILQELSTRSRQKFSKTKKSSVSQQKHEYDKIIYLAENSVVAFRQRVADKCELFCSRTLYLLYCKRIKKNSNHFNQLNSDSLLYYNISNKASASNKYNRMFIVMYTWAQLDSSGFLC